MKNKRPRQAKEKSLPNKKKVGKVVLSTLRRKAVWLGMKHQPQQRHIELISSKQIVLTSQRKRRGRHRGCMSVISALWKLKQEDHWEFNASLAYIVRSYRRQKAKWGILRLWHLIFCISIRYQVLPRSLSGFGVYYKTDLLLTCMTAVMTKSLQPTLKSACSQKYPCRFLKSSSVYHTE